MFRSVRSILVRLYMVLGGVSKATAVAGTDSILESTELDTVAERLAFLGYLKEVVNGRLFA